MHLSGQHWRRVIGKRTRLLLRTGIVWAKAEYAIAKARVTAGFIDIRAELRLQCRRLDRFARNAERRCIREHRTARALLALHAKTTRRMTKRLVKRSVRSAERGLQLAESTIGSWERRIWRSAFRWKRRATRHARSGITTMRKHWKGACIAAVVLAAGAGEAGATAWKHAAPLLELRRDALRRATVWGLRACVRVIRATAPAIAWGAAAFERFDAWCREAVFVLRIRSYVLMALVARRTAPLRRRLTREIPLHKTRVLSLVAAGAIAAFVLAELAYARSAKLRARVRRHAQSMQATVERHWGGTVFRFADRAERPVRRLFAKARRFTHPFRGVARHPLALSVLLLALSVMTWRSLANTQNLAARVLPASPLALIDTTPKPHLVLQQSPPANLVAAAAPALDATHVVAPSVRQREEVFQRTAVRRAAPSRRVVADFGTGEEGQVLMWIDGHAAWRYPSAVPSVQPATGRGRQPAGADDERRGSSGGRGGGGGSPQPAPGGGGLSQTEADGLYVNVSGDVMNGSLQITSTGLSFEAAGTVSGAALTVSDLQSCDTIDTDSSGNFVCGTDSGAGGGISQTEADARYVRKAGGTMTGALVIDLTTGTVGIEVVETVSGSIIFANNALLSSGALTIEGSAVIDAGTLFVDASTNRVGVGTSSPDVALDVIGTVSGSALTVSGLRNCDTIDTDSNGNLVCGSDGGGSGGSFGSGNVLTLGDARYVNQSGDTMTGALTVNVTGGTATTVGLEVIQVISGATVHANALLRSSGSLVIEGAATIDAGTLVVDATQNRVGVGTASPDTALDVVGTISGSLLTISAGGNSYILGALSLGNTSPDTGVKLEVVGTASGRIVRAQNTLASSGTLVWEGAASGASLYVGTSINGAGLTDCDLTTSVLKWDGTTGRFSCGTSPGTFGSGNVLTIGDDRYVRTAGDTMTGTLTIDLTTGTVGLEVVETASGNIVHAQSELRSSGSLVVESNVNFDAGTFVVDATQNRVGILTTSPDTALDVVGTISGSTLTIMNNTSYILGSVGIGTTAPDTGVKLEIIGTASGRIVRAQNTLASSGTLVFEGAGSGASLYIGTSLQGIGLTDCDAANAVLRWDSSTGRFSCAGSSAFGSGNVLTLGDARYVNQSGDTMTGALTVNVTGGTATTVGLEVIQVISGATVHANALLRSSGSLAVEGNATIDAGTLFVDASSNEVGILTTSPDTALDVLGTISGTTLTVMSSLGVGTASPDTTAEIAGALKLSTSTTDTFQTPVGNSVPTKIHVPLFDPGAFGQIFSFGLASGVTDSARAILAMDARTTEHQPTLLVLTPDENEGLGITFDGSNTVGYIKSSVDIGFKLGTLTTGSELMRLAESTSNVGIGTSSPDTGVKLEVIGTVSGALIRGQRTLASSGTLVWEGTASGASLYVATSLQGVGLTDCDLTTSVLKWDITTGRFSCGTSSGTFGSGNVLTLGDARYVKKSGDTMTGALVIDLAGATTGVGLEVTETASGNIVHAQAQLRSSGALVVEGNMSGASFAGAGLYDCEGASNKLVWDSATMKFGCASDEVGAGSSKWTDDGPITYLTNTTDDLVVGGSTSTAPFYFDTSELRLDVTNLSGVYLHAQSLLASSGALAIEGSATFDAGTLFVDSSANRVGIGTTSPDTALDVIGTISGSKLTVMNDSTSYILGNLGIGTTSVDTGVKFEVIGTISGTTLRTSNGASHSGTLALEGSLTGATIAGFGLTDCDGSTSKLLWDTTTGKFSCGTDLSLPDTATFFDGTSETWADNETTDLWDGTLPNITTAASSNSVYVTVSVHVEGGGTDDEMDVFRIMRDIDTNPTCSGTEVGSGTLFTTNTGESGSSVLSLIDNVATAGNIRYTICTSIESSGTVNNVTRGIFFYLMTVGADLAENYYTTDATIEAGDVVAIDGSFTAGVQKSMVPYEQQMIGVVSTQPWRTLDDGIGIGRGRPVPIALVGRVPVKVTTGNGPIVPGDLLTSSSVPGVAMKATRPGPVLGKAMTPFDADGIGMVMAFVKSDYYSGDDPFTLIDGSGGALGQLQTDRQFVLNASGSGSVRRDALRVLGGPADHAATALRITGDGVIESKGTNYAQWFKTGDQGLQSGEIVCIDPASQNGVKRCARAADANVVGVISANPAFVGNMLANAEGMPVPGYALVGLMGQLNVKVNLEGGAIRPGDELTPAAVPGYARRAAPGEPTVGVAMESMEELSGEISVLLARRNGSLIVDTIEAGVMENIAGMEIDDEVQLLVANALRGTDFDALLQAEVREQLDALQAAPLIGDIIDREIASAVPRSLSALTASETLAVGGDIALSGSLLALGEVRARALTASETLAVGGDAVIGGSLRLGGNLVSSGMLVLNALAIDGDAEIRGALVAGVARLGSGSTVGGDFRVAGALAAGSLTIGGQPVDIAQLLAREGMQLLGDITIQGLATFLGDVEIGGHVIVSNRQAGFAVIPVEGASVTVGFEQPWPAVPIISATPNLPVLFAVTQSAETGFVISLASPATAEVRFAWIAMLTENPETIEAERDGTDPVDFPVDASGTPTSTSAIWNACIRNQTPLDETGQPYNCGRYHSGYTWQHPDLGIEFLWNTSLTPPLLRLPPGYRPTIGGDAVMPAPTVIEDEEGAPIDESGSGATSSFSAPERQELESSASSSETPLEESSASSASSVTEESSASSTVEEVGTSSVTEESSASSVPSEESSSSEQQSSQESASSETAPEAPAESSEQVPAEEEDPA